MCLICLKSPYIKIEKKIKYKIDVKSFLNLDNLLSSCVTVSQEGGEAKSKFLPLRTGYFS